MRAICTGLCDAFFFLTCGAEAILTRTDPLIVYFSTVIRGARLEHSGELVKLDWDAKRVVSRAPLFATHPPLNDPNPRGNSRGGRGILLNGSKIFAATYHTLHVFDRNLQPLPPVEHSLFCNLHELNWDGQAIWATSTGIDGAIKCDTQGRTLDEWWPREDPVLRERYQLEPLEIDKTQDNRCRFIGASAAARGHVHLNAMAMHEGRPVALLNRFGCIVKLRPTQVLVDDRTLRGAHNLLVRENGEMLVNDTVNRAVRVYNSEGGLLRRIDLRDLAPVRRIRRRFRFRDLGIWLARHGRPARLFYRWFGHLSMARPVFVRGLTATARETVLVGISPATILEIDPDSGVLRDSFTYSSDVHHAIHGVACCEADAGHC